MVKKQQNLRLHLVRCGLHHGNKREKKLLPSWLWLAISLLPEAEWLSACNYTLVKRSCFSFLPTLLPPITNSFYSKLPLSDFINLMNCMLHKGNTSRYLYRYLFLFVFILQKGLNRKLLIYFSSSKNRHARLHKHFSFGRYYLSSF